jgi:beta-lactamase class D
MRDDRISRLMLRVDKALKFIARWLHCAVYLATLGCSVLCFGTTAEIKDLSEFFRGRDGCFVLYDSTADRYIRHNPKGCAERFSPCSTFKIPNTLIALDTGVASGPEFTLRWDGINRGGSWDRDHTLRSAFQGSVVWYYQELVRRVGHQRESEFVRKLQYGNMDTTGGTTNFWLESSLLISADEQVEFLRRLWSNALPVSLQSQQVTRSIMEVSKADGRIVYGKTGTGGDSEKNVARLGWFVGCVEHGNRRVFFATRITGDDGASGKAARNICEEILASLEI